MDEDIDRLISAINLLISEDMELLKQDVHESSISGMMIEHLANSFDEFDYDIDTQYNKMILDNKLVRKQAEFLVSELPQSKQKKTGVDTSESALRNILPDIIFHNRNSNTQNFMVIEIKKTTNKSKTAREWDILKLKTMTSGRLNYSYGVFIDFKTGEDFDLNQAYMLQVYSEGIQIL